MEAVNPEAALEVRKKKAALRKEQRRKQAIRKKQEEVDKENRPVEKEKNPKKTPTKNEGFEENVVETISRQKFVGIKRKRENAELRKKEMAVKEKQLKEGKSKVKQRTKKIEEIEEAEDCGQRS